MTITELQFSANRIITKNNAQKSAFDAAVENSLPQEILDKNGAVTYKSLSKNFENLLRAENGGITPNGKITSMGLKRLEEKYPGIGAVSCEVWTGSTEFAAARELAEKIKLEPKTLAKAYIALDDSKDRKAYARDEIYDSLVDEIRTSNGKIDTASEKAALAARLRSGQTRAPQKQGQNLLKTVLNALRNNPNGCWVEAEHDINDSVARPAHYAVPCPKSEAIVSAGKLKSGDMEARGYFYDSLQGWVYDPTNDNFNNPRYFGEPGKKSKNVSREESIEKMRVSGYFYDSMDGWISDPTNNDPRNPNYMKRN